MAALSGWIGDTRPDAMVVDVSVEVALLARLHGAPVLTMAQPGRRVDPAHTLGYTVSEQILAPWPAGVGPIWQTAATATTGKIIHLGAVSRFGVLTEPGVGTPYTVLVLNGAGGGALDSPVGQAEAATPGWDWVHLGPGGTLAGRSLAPADDRGGRGQPLRAERGGRDRRRPSTRDPGAPATAVR